MTCTGALTLAIKHPSLDFDVAQLRMVCCDGDACRAGVPRTRNVRGL